METSWSVLSKQLRPRSSKIASKVRVFYAGLPRPHIMREKTVRRHGNYRLNVLYESWILTSKVVVFAENIWKNGKNFNGVQRSCFLYRFYCFLWTFLKGVEPWGVREMRKNEPKNKATVKRRWTPVSQKERELTSQLLNESIFRFAFWSFSPYDIEKVPHPTPYNTIDVRRIPQRPCWRKTYVK